MSKMFEVWCDSGANIHSCYKTEVYLEDLNIDEDEWVNMSEEDQYEVMREIAFERLDWGFREIE